jgi:hypothetical protein
MAACRQIGGFKVFSEAIRIGHPVELPANQMSMLLSYAHIPVVAKVSIPVC